ncbi:hypothetical protein CFP65_5703 [Kitasatospora sp. MMS16-BH015]|uniref:DUF1684 domain-containing protein n=1 Tax=Kitasatospora sp. MMS16-BH015 TaxID=2018025 RepID=UPI000CA3B5F0|nr:DUF1684 domain-containing protein [Kitasatospora sp. MMS16-BH015]AUG80397.1 hypothetical protein CFP65_5703 [Kitasatospora sp. MMS16-BH015]
MSAAEEWQHWTEGRTARASAPHGPLALIGTYWLEPEPGKVPGLPGEWWAADGRVRVRASAADGLRVRGAEGGPVDGERALRPDTDGAPELAEYGEVLLVPIDREGELALRVFDPAAPGRAAFAGITVYPYAPEWAVPAVFTPFERAQELLVPNADGRERPLVLAGRLAFSIAGEPHTLAVSSSGAGLSGVIADATSGRETYRFRFVGVPEPDAEGRTVLDFNRAYLPPCAFADHFVCPFPPPGNRLGIAVEAGEKQVLSR